jgi:hypothetical protein
MRKTGFISLVLITSALASSRFTHAGQDAASGLAIAEAIPEHWTRYYQTDEDYIDGHDSDRDSITNSKSHAASDSYGHSATLIKRKGFGQHGTYFSIPA